MISQPSWQPGLTTVTQSSQAFHNLRLIHFNVFRMRRPDLLQEQERGITSLQSSRAYTGFRSGSALSTSSACSCTWCELVAALRTCRTWWHPSLTCLVVRDWDHPAASDMNFHGWNWSSASGVSRSPDRRHGILFRPNSQTLILSKTCWKLTFSSSRIRRTWMTLLVHHWSL